MGQSLDSDLLTVPQRGSLTQHDHTVQGLVVKQVAPASPLVQPPMLLLHGGMHGWWTWRLWQSFLGACGWNTFTMSLRGHTGSRDVAVAELLSLTLSDYAQDVTTVLDWIGQPVVLVAHSMGGAVAQQVAQRHQLAALVLVASVGPGQSEVAVRDDLPTDRPFWLSEEQARALFFHKIDDRTFEKVYSALVPESPSVLNDYTRGGRVPSPDIGCPVLVMEADRDREVIREHARANAEFYSAPLVTMRDTGHDLMLEPAAEQAAAIVNAWLVAHLPNALEGVAVDQSRANT